MAEGAAGKQAPPTSLLKQFPRQAFPRRRPARPGDGRGTCAGRGYAAHARDAETRLAAWTENSEAVSRRRREEAVSRRRREVCEELRAVVR
jgi:hypothetical protein